MHEPSIESYDSLFDVMLEMGALMEKQAVPAPSRNIALPIIWNRDIKRRIFSSKPANRSPRQRKKPAGCISEPCPKSGRPAFFTGVPMERCRNPMKWF